MTCRSEIGMKFRPVDGKWYDIPGYEGRYQINSSGHVRSIIYTEPKMLRECVDTNRGIQVYVHMYNNQHVKHHVFISTLMANTFWGGKPKGYVMMHIDGMQTNNDIENLRMVSMKECSVVSSGNRRKPVARISEKGEILQVYPSALIASKSCHMCYEAVQDRCNKKIANEFRADGTTYRWYQTDSEVKKFCRLLKNAAVRSKDKPRPREEWEW